MSKFYKKIFNKLGETKLWYQENNQNYKKYKS